MAAPNVLMIFPRFNPNSFWSLQAACDARGAKCPAPPLGMITLAALLPRDWNIKLVNRNAEELKTEDIDWADMVMTGGMLPQQIDTLHLVGLAQARGKPVVVGGPNVTSSPEVFSHADFLVLGEAEGVINKFVEGWNAGERCGRYEAEKFTVDVSKSPIPRFDLLNFKHYLYVGVQFSRGCPFNCEFCDIIELYGKVPRAKTNAQMLAELQTLYDLGYRGHVDFVDDNLIGNKKALKAFLPALRTWQEERGYPFEFSTEASMNLADDGQLLAMMKTANFFAIFMGIESPDAETLIATQKKQNTRRSLAESVHKIYGAGMFVIAGFIVGFDTEKGGMAAGMIDCIEASSIPACMVGLLTALPNTQLMRRLQAEKRLLPLVSEDGDQCLAGLNFVTLRARRDILEDYKTVLEAVYEPSAYFARVRGVGRALKRLDLPSKAHTKHNFQLLLQLMSHMTVQRPDLRQHFWKTFLDTARHNPGALESIVSLMLLYLHLGAFSQHVVRELDKQIAAIETEAQQQVIAASAAA
jgi:radical SAM superfamily enzyme YgiQ (UPF0313 family)